MVGCPAGLVLEAWWPGVGNSRFAAVEGPLRVGGSGGRLGFVTKNIKIRKVLIILNKHGKSIVFRLSVKEYNHVCISEVL